MLAHTFTAYNGMYRRLRLQRYGKILIYLLFPPKKCVFLHIIIIKGGELQSLLVSEEALDEVGTSHLTEQSKDGLSFRWLVPEEELSLGKFLFGRLG